MTLRILEERKFPVRDLRAFASPRSVGKTVTFAGEPVRKLNNVTRGLASLPVSVRTEGR